MSDNICSELIDDIFTRLPLKSLLRFRSVSKSFCARISSPDFIRMHALRSPPKYLIRPKNRSCLDEYYTIYSEDQLTLGGYDDETTFKFPYKHTFDIVGSCNGILCLYETDGSYFSLWNPSIRHKRKIPDDIPYWAPNSCDHSVEVGFGFDPVNNDYKIVLLSYSRDGKSPVRSFVYTMKTDAWSEIQVPYTPFSIVSSYACLFNGALYWIAYCDLTRVNDIGSRYILTFDLSTHVFNKIVLPKPDWGCHILAIIKGSLAVFSTTYGNNNNSGIWLREEHDDTSSWSVVFESSTAKFHTDKIFELTTNGDFLFHSEHWTSEVYNLETGVSKRLTEHSDKVNIEKFVESLELIGKGTIYEEKKSSSSRSQMEKKTTYTRVGYKKWQS